MTRKAKAGAATDCGSATLWTVAVALVVMMSTAAVSLIAIAISARHRVATAADLSALAAATTLGSVQAAGDADATEQACRVAADIANANGARIDRCQIEGSMVDVLATMTVPAVGYVSAYSVTAHARAGPS